MPVNCTACSTPVPASSRFCVACSEDAGYPNVRAATEPPERLALSQKLQEALAEASHRGCGNEMARLRVLASGTKAVICMSASNLQRLLSSDSQLFSTFYGQMQGGSRVPEDNDWDRMRAAADAMVFPNYYDQIRFGALSLDGTGAYGYGPCAVTLKESFIANRTTVFWENSAVFVKRRAIFTSAPIPPGFRAPWAQRDEIAAAKLGSRLAVGMDDGDLSGLIKQNGRDEDIIEVNIYGSMSRETIGSIVADSKLSRPDRLMVAAALETATALGIPMELR